MALTPREHGEARRTPATPAAKKEGGRLLQKLRNSVSATTAIAIAGLLGVKAAHATDTNVVVLSQNGDNAMSVLDIDTSLETPIQEFTLTGGSSAWASGIVISNNEICTALENATTPNIACFDDLTSTLRTSYVNTTSVSDIGNLIKDEDTNTFIALSDQEVVSVDAGTMTVNGTSSAVSYGEFYSPLLLGSSQVAIADYGNDAIDIFDYSSGTPTLTDQWSMSGCGPVWITADDTPGYLKVSCLSSGTIETLDSSGTTLDSMTSSTGYPNVTFVDSNGNLWESSSLNPNIIIYEDTDGDYIQDTVVTTITIGTDVSDQVTSKMAEFDGNMYMGTQESTTGTNLLVTDINTFSYGQYVVSGMSGNAHSLAVGTISDGSGTDADGDTYVDDAEGGDDCDDSDATVNPGATEICGDSTDQDCSGSANDGTTDADGDGSIDETCDSGDDCDDGDATVNPSAGETPYNSKDDDCDPATLEDDLDEDGHDSTATGGDDCDDSDINVNPDQPEVCDDGVDNDCVGGDETCPPEDDDGDGVSNDTDLCSGTTNYPTVDTDGCDTYQRDADFDGSVEAYDCDDNDPDRSPDYAEVNGNGIDDDCNDATSDEVPSEDDDNDGVPNDTDICPDTPTEEVANDDGCSPSQLTTTHDEDNDGYEDENYGGDDCDDNDPDTHPDAEEKLVDGKDQDCDELVDDIADAVVLTGVQGSFSYTVDFDTKQITITPEDNTWENGDISGYRIDQSWDVNLILTGEDGAGYSMGTYGSGWDVRFTGPMRYITTLEPTLSLKEDNVAFGYLNNTGATATVNEDTSEVTADTDGDGQEEVLIPAEGSGDDDTGPQDDDTAPDDDHTEVNPPTGPDCGGCDTIKGQPNPGATIAAVGAAILALLRRRKEPDLKKAA